MKTSFREHLRRVMLTYPRIFPNAISVYKHIFIDIGTEYEWSDGSLIDIAEDYLCENVESAINKVISGNNDSINIAFTDHIFNSLNASTYINARTEESKQYVHNILSVDEKLDDLSIPDEMVFRLNKWSLIANIPEEVTTSILDEMHKLVQILDKNKDRLVDTDNLFDSIKDRINYLYK